MLSLSCDQTGLFLSSGSNPTPFGAWAGGWMSHQALPPLHRGTKISYSKRRNVCWVVKINGSLSPGCPESLNSGWWEVWGSWPDYPGHVSMKINGLRSNVWLPPFFKHFGFPQSHGYVHESQNVFPTTSTESMFSTNFTSIIPCISWFQH